ncbi:FIP1[III]-like protein isoform X2 [Vigna radiata var. radiata]|uniref:FIP1[III]-like protein isoform X2 n=1 Tax=Vigna radiata var. radiata TaxID=3916 RepID=A0A3Q0EPD6_VIGRR|nr:FIP1[III]-like protein isoform X2 [Vigna radiata var. radiata]
MEEFHHDDDFGELYAVDIEGLNAIAEEQDEEEEEKLDVTSNIFNLDEDKSNEKVNDDCAAASDSDDDLKIVLNDEDSPVGVVGCDDDGGYGDDGDDNGSRLYGNKSGRSRGLAFVDIMTANAAMGMASYISSLKKGRRNGDACIQNLALSSSRVCLAANPLAVQCGYGSVIPWGIFDVNIDTFMEKPWNVPGVDVTNYFNFGFNESTWKLYCASLKQLWRTSLQTGISVDNSAKWNQEAVREQTDQAVLGSVLFPSSDCELPKGRAIQVEDSTVERQPSIDVRRPRNRDFNVIEIKLLESSDDCSGSGNSTVMDASLEGESMAANMRNILDSSNERDEVVSEDQLEDVIKAEESSVLKRTGTIIGVNGDEHRDQPNQISEDTTEVPEGEIKTDEGGGIEPCSSYPHWIESELSLGDQEHSLTSYSDSDSEPTENSVHLDNDTSPSSPIKRKPLNCVTDMKKSSSFNWKNSKNNNVNEKTVNIAYNSRTRGLFRKEWRHQREGYESGYNMNEHTENGNDVFSILKSKKRNRSPLAHRFVDYGRQKDQLQTFGSQRKRDGSYNRETKQSYYYGDEKVVDELITRSTKYYHEDRGSFRENTNRYDRKNGDVGDYISEPGYCFADNEDRDRDWYHPDFGSSAYDLSPCSYREPRQFLPKHSSSLYKERRNQRKRVDGRSHFIDSKCIDGFDEREFEFVNKSYRMATSAAEREMKSSYINCEEQFPQIGTDWKRSVRRGRHCDSSRLLLNNSCSGIMEDNCPKYAHCHTSNLKYHKQSYTDSMKNYAYGARVNENFGDCGRDKRDRDNRGSYWSSDYTETVKDEIYPVEEYQFYRSPSKFLDWNEDEIIYRHHEATLCAKVQSDDMPLQRHWVNVVKRDTEKYFKASSKTMYRSKGGQAVLRCRKAVDLIDREGKSQVRSSRVLSNGRLENVNQRIAKKRMRDSVGFDESNERASKFDASKYESNLGSKKWVQNLQDQGQKESSDIEEGQIVTKKCKSSFEKPSTSRRDASKGPAVTDSVKRMSQNEGSSDQCIGGFDSQRILDSLAKMEKRRERFKQPIPMKKEAEENLKLTSDSSIVDTCEIKQHRPVRKRRWVGN